MSPTLMYLVNQLVALAALENVSQAELLVAIQTASGLNSDGISDPNANPHGLYRDSNLEAFKSQLAASGAQYPAELLCTWIASTPGAALIKDPVIKVQVETDVSYSGNVTVNPGDQGHCFVFTVTPGALGPDIQRAIDPATGLGVFIPDAMASPRGCDTIEDVRRYFKQRVADYLKANSVPPPPGVDFSPAKP